MFKLMITGHRPHKLPGGYDLQSKENQLLKEKIKRIVLKTKSKYPDLIIISGMALGVDMMFAEIAIELEIPLHAYIPCPEQSSRWNEKDKKRHEYLLSKADKINISGKIYSPSIMQKRNMDMINNSNGAIAVWNGDTSGGTYNALKEIRKSNLPHVIINPITLSVTNKGEKDA